MPAMKTIIITGTSTGIGFASAVALARAGHDVFATMRNPGRSPELQVLASKETLPITILPLDVNNDASVSKAVSEVLESRGHVDVLVNNAGIASLGSVEETPLDEYRQIMETNVFGVLRSIKAVLPSMRARRSGHIINISSVAGRMTSPGQSAYAASKFALEAIGESLAAEVRPFNIRVSIVEPGVTDTPIFGKGRDVSREIYPGARRLNALFAALLENPFPAAAVGDQIRDIVAGESWQLRYPAGPMAEAVLGHRAATPDEQHIADGALDDEAWCALQERRGLNVRAHLAPPPAR
jgi:NAD(P)-dependent dehydrogenase (short-subunit alcohol dehydrogenase family)